VVYLTTIDGANPVGLYEHNGTTWKLIVDSSTAQTLTNKTLTGNIATNLVSGAATVTLPTTTSTLATLALAETLTNKTLSIASNTLSGHTANAVITADGSGNAAAGVAPGSSGNVLTSNGTTWASATPSSAPDQSYEISNLSIAASVAASALTISLKDKAGSDPSGASIVKIGFRNSTVATGTYNQRSVSSALSVVVSSGSTLGHANGVAQYIYVYALDNAGTVELAVSSVLYEDGSIQSTTAEGGAGASDSNRVIYSTTARSNVPVRLIGRLTSTQATAGTWATGMSAINLSPVPRELVAVHYTTTGQTVVTGAADLNYTTKVRDTHNCYSSGTITVPATGLYIVAAGFESDTSIAAAAITNEVAISIVVDGTVRLQDRSCPKTTSAQNKWCQNVSAPIYLTAGQLVKAQAYHETGTNMVMNSTAYGNFISLVQVY
jgi:hypothetical protein